MEVSPNDGLSRRRLLGRTGISAISAVLGANFLGVPNALGAAQQESPFTSANEAKTVLLSSFRTALSETPLPAHSAETTVVGIEFTDPRLTLTVIAKPDSTRVTNEVQQTEASVVIAMQAAHKLLIGAMTTAYAVASQQISLVGDRRKIAILAHAPAIIRNTYMSQIKSVGKGSYLSFEEKDVI